MDLQPGDEVTFEIPELPCIECKQQKLVATEDSHFLFVVKGEPIGILCAVCADSEEKRQIPIGTIMPIVMDRPLGDPITGNFKPLETSKKSESPNLDEVWKDRSHELLKTMATWQGLVLKFLIGGNRYKGVWVKPTWEDRRVTSLTFSGNTESTGLDLDVYQVSRLKKLGLHESGRTNKVWSVDLSPSEQDVLNATAVMFHVFRYGFLLEPSDMYSISPTLDIDLTDPEWKHPGKSG